MTWLSRATAIPRTSAAHGGAGARAGAFSRLAASWGARLVLELGLDLVDGQLVLASLAVLDWPTAAVGGEALAELAQSNVACIGRSGWLRTG